MVTRVWVYLTIFWQVYTTDWSKSLVVDIYNVNTVNLNWFKHIENIFNIKNVVLFLRSFSTQMRTSFCVIIIINPKTFVIQICIPFCTLYIFFRKYFCNWTYLLTFKKFNQDNPLLLATKQNWKVSIAFPK